MFVSVILHVDVGLGVLCMCLNALASCYGCAEGERGRGVANIIYGQVVSVCLFAVI